MTMTPYPRKSKRSAGFVLHVPIGDHERRAQMNANGHHAFANGTFNRYFASMKFV